MAVSLDNEDAQLPCCTMHEMATMGNECLSYLLLVFFFA